MGFKQQLITGGGHIGRSIPTWRFPKILGIPLFNSWMLDFMESPPKMDDLGDTPVLGTLPPP
jgi:hypothetical protein